MISEKEYFLLTFLSYCNFTSKFYGKTLFEIWKGNLEKNFSQSTFLIFSEKFEKPFLSFFEKELKEWSVFYVDNRRANNSASSKSGFYAVCFKNTREEYVLSFRGSEVRPIEDAYLDFISTDLSIGIGKIPLQFQEGVECYEKIIQKFQIDYPQISLAGHSLGGGIAQYVALSTNRLHQYIPITCTWNAIGINKKGIVHIGEFLNLHEALEKSSILNIEEKNTLFPFVEKYQEFFSEEYQKVKSLKNINPTLDSVSLKSLFSQNMMENFLKYLKPKQKEKILQYKDIWAQLFNLQNFYQKIKDGELFIEKINQNKEYQKRIVNYGHSEDLTNSLFPHIGENRFIDKKLMQKKWERENFLEKIQLFKKSFTSYHRESIFLPYFGVGKEAQNLQKALSKTYLAAVLRKLIQQEKLFSNDFLADFYSFDKLEDKTVLEYKQQILKATEKYSKFLYPKEVRIQLKNLSVDEFKTLWKETQARISNPYRYKDIFDILLYEYFN